MLTWAGLGPRRPIATNTRETRNAPAATSAAQLSGAWKNLPEALEHPEPPDAKPAGTGAGGAWGAGRNAGEVDAALYATPSRARSPARGASAASPKTAVAPAKTAPSEETGRNVQVESGPRKSRKHPTRRLPGLSPLLSTPESDRRKNRHLVTSERAQCTERKNESWPTTGAFRRRCFRPGGT